MGNVFNLKKEVSTCLPYKFFANLLRPHFRSTHSQVQRAAAWMGLTLWLSFLKQTVALSLFPATWVVEVKRDTPAPSFSHGAPWDREQLLYSVIAERAFSALLRSQTVQGNMDKSRAVLVNFRPLALASSALKCPTLLQRGILEKMFTVAEIKLAKWNSHHNSSYSKSNIVITSVKQFINEIPVPT